MKRIKFVNLLLIMILTTLLFGCSSKEDKEEFKPTYEINENSGVFKSSKTDLRKMYLYSNNWFKVDYYGNNDYYLYQDYFYFSKTLKDKDFSNYRADYLYPILKLKIKTNAFKDQIFDFQVPNEEVNFDEIVKYSRENKDYIFKFLEDEWIFIVINKLTNEEIYNETYSYENPDSFDVSIDDEQVSFGFTGNSIENRFTHFQIIIRNKQTLLHWISLWVLN